MKKKIIFVSIFSIFLMLMIPNINAVNTQLIKNMIEGKIENFKKNIEEKNLDKEKQLIISKIFEIIKNIDLKIILVRLYFLFLVIMCISILVNIQSIKDLIEMMLFGGIFSTIITQVYNYKIFGNSITASSIISGFLWGILFPFLTIPWALNIFIFLDVKGPIATLYFNLFKLACGIDTNQNENIEIERIFLHNKYKMSYV